MNIFVTGATGFLGRALTADLRKRGHRVLGVGSRNCDLTDSSSLRRFTQRFDQIWHLAAWTQAGDFCLYHTGEQWLKNQLINANVLAWWQRQQPQAKLIAMGTSCSYPPDHDLVEENYLLGEPIESLYTYAMTKRMLYIGMQALHRQFGLRYLCLVPSTLYGPNYHTDDRQLHFIFDLIRKIVQAKRDGTPVVLWGDGHQRRELVYIDDFVDAALQLAECADNTIINIGAGAEHSIRDFARMICELVDYDFDEIRFDTTRYVGAKSKCLAVGRLREYLPRPAPTDLYEGLRRTVEWLTALQQASNLRAWTIPTSSQSNPESGADSHASEACASQSATCSNIWPAE